MSHSKLVVVGAIALIVLFAGLGVWNSMAPGKYDAFAACLGERGATFFGAFWCPHCQEQKALFGRSENHLPYVECSLPNGQGQTEECIAEGIEGYPTWEFADGERMGGVIQLATLAEKTGCELPD